MSRIYSVEGAVLSCVTIAYLAARASLTSAPLEDAHLVPAAVLGIFALVCTTITPNVERVQRTYFHVIFAFWLSLAYGLVEAATAGAIQVNTFSASVSLALLTVQVLIAAAAVSETLWHGSAWADLAVILITWFQACVSHATQGSLAAAGIMCFANGLSAALLYVRPFYQMFPEQAGTGAYSLQQILEILSASLKSLSVVLAIAIAYASGSTIWGLPVFLAIPMAVIVKSAVSAPAHTVEEKPIPEQNQETFQVPEQGARPPPYNPQLFDIHVPTGKTQAPVDRSLFFDRDRSSTATQAARTSFFNLDRPSTATQATRSSFFNQAPFSSAMPAPTLTPDALLFKNTRALINVSKKNS